MGKKLFLVDGHSHCYQAFYAIQGLTSPDGTPVNAVYGFVNILRKILKDYAPDYLAVAFDRPGRTFRHDLYDQYKATRKPPPEEFVAQLPLIEDVLAAYDIPVYAVDGYEADDVLGTLARQGAEKGLDVRLLTTDKDARQLLGPRVRMLDTRDGKETTAETLDADDGIRPDQVVDVMALTGDTSDNVPGVAGIGPKTAIPLIREWGDLDGLLAHLDEAGTPRVREKLREHLDDIRLSRKLVTIDTDVPVELDEERCAVRAPDAERLRSVFERFGFRSFLEDLGPVEESKKGAYELVADAAAFARLLAALREQKRFSFDCETTSVDPMSAALVGMSFSWQSGKGYYLPVRAPAGDPTLELEPTLAALAPILSSPAIEKVGQNLKYDAIVMANHGVPLRGIAFDTMIARYVLDPTRGRYNLDDMALDLLQYHTIPISRLIGKGRNQTTMDTVPVAQVREYAAEDADIAWRLTEQLEPELKRQGFDALFREVELPLIPVLVDMEYCGFRLDVPFLAAMSQELETELASLEKKIYTEAGVEFNINSPKQLAEVLFVRLGLPVKRRTKTGPSTDAEVLAELAFEHRVPALVMEHRQLKKLKSTYVDALPAMVNPRTGRIHGSFNQAATATGRLSSSDPNLQNIPVRTELGGKIRRAFIPREDGWLLLGADYSQIELRLLAHIAADEALIEAFHRDQDIHAFVAGQINNVEPGEVTDAMRRTAKAVNFGIVYGQTPYGLSRGIGVSVSDAEKFIRAYFERYPQVRRFIDRTLEEARERKYVETLWGRRRPLDEIDARNPARRHFAERAAVNTIVQGSAADLIKIAMARIAARMRDEKLRGHMLLQVHDELIFETPADELDRLREMVVAEMTSVRALRVPIRVNTGVGANWLEAK